MTLLILILLRLWTGKRLQIAIYIVIGICQGTSSPPTTLMGMPTPEITTGCGERPGLTMEESLDARWEV